MSIDFKSIQIMISETHMIYFYKSTIQTSFWKEMCQKKSNIDTTIDFVKKNNIFKKQHSLEHYSEK